MAKIRVEANLEETLKEAWDNASTKAEESELLDAVKEFIDKYGEKFGRTYYVVTTLEEAQELVSSWSE